MTEEKTCYNCGNKNCNVYYSTVKKDYKRHFEVYEYKDFDCVNHDKWEELKVEEIRTDNTETMIWKENVLFYKIIKEVTMFKKEKVVFTDRKDFEKVLAENKTDFIICQKGKGHYQIVGYHTIMTSEGDTTIVLELGKRMEG